MTLLAVAGRAEDHEILAAAYRGGEGEAHALGLHGHVALAELLLDALVRPGSRLMLGPSQRAEAAAALVRLTGAPLLVDPTDPYVARYEPHDWRDVWSRIARTLDPARRHRWGRPWSPRDPLDELDADRVPTGVRKAAALELAIVLGEPPILLHTFAKAQHDALGRARASTEARLAEGSLTVGTFR
jgi:hypothetical protein